jgi:uracil-DNA glycosylase family 4
LQRIEDEAALAEAGMRHSEAAQGYALLAQRQQIEIENTVSPALRGAAAEAALGMFEKLEKRRCGAGPAGAKHGVGEAAGAGADGGGGMEARERVGREACGGEGSDRGAQHGFGPAMAAMAAVAPQSDQRHDGGMMRAEPDVDCPLCPRLVAYRQENRARNPGWHNAPVPGWGDPEAWLLVLGLAPGVSGANRTGRPFTGDTAGTLLYETLLRCGLASGAYEAHADDGLRLEGVFISNAVRCVPPGNKPVPAEVHACRPFLLGQMAALPRAKVILALGQIAHQSAVKACGGKLPKTPFAHGAVHRLHTGYTVVDSYHCSRLNTNTGRLTAEMFEAVFRTAMGLRQIS